MSKLRSADGAEIVIPEVVAQKLRVYSRPEIYELKARVSPGVLDAFVAIIEGDNRLYKSRTRILTSSGLYAQNSGMLASRKTFTSRQLTTPESWKRYGS